jgi:hypothetical protein
MTTTHHKIGTVIAALVTGTLAIFPALETNAANRPTPAHNRTPRPAVVHSSHLWQDPCPAVDTVPICDIAGSLDRSGSDGSKVAIRPAPAEANTVWIGDAKDHPGYGPVNPAATTSDWVDSIGLDCRRVPWPQIVECPD